jgi:hypothetical protein
VIFIAAALILAAGFKLFPELERKLMVWWFKQVVFTFYGI